MVDARETRRALLRSGHCRRAVIERAADARTSFHIIGLKTRSRQPAQSHSSSPLLLTPTMISHLRVISFRRISTIHALRTAPSSLQAFRITRQQFSSTPHRRASEDPDVFISAFKNTALFRELADKPEVLQATKDLVRVLQEEGRHHWFSSDQCRRANKLIYQRHCREPR